MSNLVSIATGNWGTASTWGLVSAVAGTYINAETGSEILTTLYSGTRSQAFTPGAVTVWGVAVKLSVRTGTTGTMSVTLEAATIGVPGTEVTINCSDLQAATTAALDGGWIVLKFATPVLLVAATAYTLAAKTSSASQISLFRDGTTDNISRMLITSTTQAPVAADDVNVAGNYLSAGSSNSLTVTMNETAATDYGSNTTSGVTPALAICAKGTLTFASGSAANPLLRLSGHAIVYNGGTLNVGTTGTPIPRDSVGILEFDCAADGDFGLLCRNGSTTNLQGLSRTSGKNVVSCKLNTDEAINSTSLGVDTDTGWLDNDQIAVASTTRTAAQSELGAMNGNAAASTLTVDGFAGTGGGLAAAHSGTSPTQAEVINLTRNVKVRSVSSTAMTWVFVDATATVDIDWAEFYYFGQNSTQRRGIEASTTTGLFSMQFSSIHDTEVGGLTLNSATLNNITVSSNVMWNLATTTGPGCQILVATSGTLITIDSNILIKTSNSNGWTLADVGGTFTNNTVVSAAAIGVSPNEAALIGTMSGIVVHSNGAAGMQIGTAGMSGTIGTLTSWRNTTTGFASGAIGIAELTLDTPVMFGNLSENILINAVGYTLNLKSPTLNGDTSFATTNGIRISANGPVINMLIDGGDFSTVSGIKTAHTNDINIVGVSVDLRAILRNTKLGAATEVATPGNLANTGYVSSQKHDQTAGLHKTWTRYGATTGGLIIDTVIFKAAAPSLRCIPANATFKIESAPLEKGIKVALASGASATVSVWVRKSIVGDAGGVLYAGAQPRLIQRANPALGQNSDVVIATMTVANSSGTWEQLSGASSTATDDGAFEYVVDADGTSGAWINVDDWSATGQGSYQNYFNGLPLGQVASEVTGSGTSRSRIQSGF